MSDIAKIIDKVKKLRSLGSSNNPNESAAALAAAEKLIIEHQIQQADLELSSPEKADALELQGVVLYETGRITPYKNFLAWEIAKISDCYALDWHEREIGRTRRVHKRKLYGKKDDIELALYLFEYACSEISRVADMFCYSVSRGVDAYRQNFTLGMAEGIIAKMREEKAAALQNATSTAMVFLGNKIKKAEDAFLNANPRIKVRAVHTSSSMSQDAKARQFGFQQGKDLDIRRGMKNSNDIKQIKD
jgi:hypothetical protein